MAIRTVLVLGAGASMPYGFPSGPQLVHDIVFKSDNFQHLFGRNSNDEINDFKKQLLESQVESVDAFLEQKGNEDFATIGKQFIAYHLLQYEVRDRLYTDKENKWIADGWYKPFLNLLDRSIEGSSDLSLAVINFNYDRSFLHFLHLATHALNSRIRTESVREALSKLPVYHIHGSLGRLPWQEGSSYPVPYDKSTPDVFSIRAAAESIKIISDPGDDPIVKQCRLLLHEAKYIFFLGFSYQDGNMRKLKCPKDGSNMPNGQDTHKVIGTWHGFEPEQLSHYEKHKFPVRFSKRKCLIHDFMKQCPEFLHVFWHPDFNDDEPE